MAVAFDAKWSGTTPAFDNHMNISGSSYSGITVGAGANALLVGFTADSLITVTGLTWDGQAMTLIGSAKATGSAWGYLYGLLAPHSGLKNVVLNYTGAQPNGYLSALSFSGVDQAAVSTSFTNFTSAITGGSSPSSITINSAVGNMAVELYATIDSGPGPSTQNQTLWFQDTSGAPNGSAQYANGAASVTFTTVIGVPSAGNIIEVGCDIVASSAAVSVGRQQGALFTPGRGPNKSLRSLKAYPPAIIVPTLDIPRRRFIHR